MDKVKGDASSPLPTTFDADGDNVEYVYSTEGTDDDDVAKYEVAPQVVKTSRVSKRSKGWTQNETFVLLKAWGERLLKNSRRCVSSVEWLEVSDKVSEASKVERNRTHCKNRMDSLKRSYKKEKAMFAENANYSSNWIFFTEMDKIVTSSLNGVYHSPDSNGTNQIENSEVQPVRAYSDDEVKESLKGDSESVKDENDNLDNSPPRKTRRVSEERGSGDAFKLRADSINKFENAYEKIQSSKFEQLNELEKFRMDIKREVEIEVEKILERGKCEIAKIWGVEIEDNDLSTPRNVSG